jgi:hypothetical protein
MRIKDRPPACGGGIELSDPHFVPVAMQEKSLGQRNIYLDRLTVRVVHLFTAAE